MKWRPSGLGGATIFVTLWLLVGAGYEAWAIFFDGGIPNNTFSHVIVDQAQRSPLLVPLGLMFFFVMCCGHWFLKKFPWRPPVWKDDPSTPEDESKRNL